MQAGVKCLLMTIWIFKKNWSFNLLCCVLMVSGIAEVRGQSFVHPGLLHSAADFSRMKSGIEKMQEPIYQGYLVFKVNAQSQSSYLMQGPMPMVGRNPTIGQPVYDKDAAAAYQNAVMWVLTGQKAYADKAIEIVNAWSRTLKSITGRDAVLMAGLGPFKMVNAAEILRYTGTGWSAVDIQKTEDHFKNVIYPVIKDYASFANGNWDTAAMKTAMAIGVFCNDRPIFEKALRYYVAGAGDGCLFNYIINETGQCQESGRDQAHTQLGIAHLADCSEIAWQQGLDLYGYGDNRLLKGFEYTAKYNLGMDVPYIVQVDQTGKYLNRQISTEARGRFRTVYEEVYNHYVKRAGLAAPYTSQVADKIRPELQGSGGDNIGFGTLFFTRPAVTLPNRVAVKPLSPAGLIARTSTTGGNTITWIKSVNADHYVVERALYNNGPYTQLSSGVSGSTYTDHQAKNGKLYYYTVSAVNSSGQSERAYPIAVTTGLPPGWKKASFGPGNDLSYADFDGTKFTLEAGGMSADSSGGRLMLYKDLDHIESITARYVPQISSQSTIMGLALRQDLAGSGDKISLILKTASPDITEAPQWIVTLSCQSNNNKTGSKTISLPVTADPMITNGRLTGYCWFRLTRKGERYWGYISADGEKWTLIGTVNSPMRRQIKAGLVISSGNPAIGTRVQFDRVVLK
jgi:hypothetical protein